MKGVLALIVPLLGGCGSIIAPTPGGNGDSPGVYTITNLYDGSQPSKERLAGWMDTEAQKVCHSPYSLISEESVPTINRLGEASFSRLVWKIRCRGQMSE
ncbi:hypothetical protein [Nitrosospira multiformis]|uniref:hypothetical protein n=1 Tax=Nitrosospira multiformis TaxID=1231 RepID=UPI00094536AF|nr:hypothetical protein [Nitrosospira multiformis]